MFLFFNMILHTDFGFLMLTMAKCLCLLDPVSGVL